MQKLILTALIGLSSVFLISCDDDITIPENQVKTPPPAVKTAPKKPIKLPDMVIKGKKKKTGNTK